MEYLGGFILLGSSLLFSVAMYKPKWITNHLRHWLFW